LNALTRLFSLPAIALSRVPGCAPLVRACSTSVGQKILMAVTGLSLCGFLVAHLGGNLLLFAGEAKFNAYAKALHEQAALLAIAETGLFVMFLAHLGLAVSTTAMNRQARKREYEMKESKQGVFALPNGGASSWMLVTGLVIFVFLLMHLADLRLKVNPLVDYTPVYPTAERAEGTANEFKAVRQVLSSPVNVAVYLAGLVALGIHLTHGVRSALQSLGLAQRRWDSLIRLVSILFGWAIAVGFISIVAWGLAAPR
jgi:succinate dehydrogenase / fumarate reductase cytochrome b subunit